MAHAYYVGALVPLVACLAPIFVQGHSCKTPLGSWMGSCGCRHGNDSGCRGHTRTIRRQVCGISDDGTCIQWQAIVKTKKHRPSYLVGVAGNLCAIHASKLATLIHGFDSAYHSEQLTKETGQLSHLAPSSCRMHKESVFRKLAMIIPSTRWTLFLLSYPMHILFLMIVSLFSLGHTSITLMFSVAYFVGVTIQVVFYCKRAAK